MSQLLRRFRMLLRRGRFNAELEEEMRLHVEMREQKNLDAGLAAGRPHHNAASAYAACVSIISSATGNCIIAAAFH